MHESVDIVNRVWRDDPDGIMEAMHSLMHLYRAQRLRALRDAGHELAPMEGRVLGFLHRHPGATQSEVAAHFGRDKAQVARLVAALRARGLLEVRADEADRRNLRLHPSAAAAGLHQKLQRQTRRINAIATADLSEADRRQMLELLQKVAARLQSLE
jgi:DNA-binding MarR family transcriptional regulator